MLLIKFILFIVFCMHIIFDVLGLEKYFSYIYDWNKLLYSYLIVRKTPLYKWHPSIPFVFKNMDHKEVQINWTKESSWESLEKEAWNPGKGKVIPWYYEGELHVFSLGVESERMKKSGLPVYYTVIHRCAEIYSFMTVIGDYFCIILYATIFKQ